VNPSNTSERGELLFIGDVHLGRRPVGLDDVLGELGISARELSPARALANAVDEALAHPPRAVVFAGDLVDQEDDRFEAYSVLEREVRRLAAAGIPVVAVAGNHDGLVLPRLIERVDGVQLLGRGGTWECWEVPGAGPAIDLIGWSFPARRYPGCPLDHGDLAQARAAHRSGATLIGVLHTQLDGGESGYAPVPRARLAETGFDAWFLGHVHRPDRFQGRAPIGYLGSLVGLDSNEPGVRGPWWVRVTDGGVQAEQFAAGPVRWEPIEVALTDADCVDAEAVHARVESALRERVAADATLGDEYLRALVVDVKLSGRLTDRAAPRELTARNWERMLTFTADNLSIVVRRLRDETCEAVELEVLAEEPSPLGYTARQILNLGNEHATRALAGAQARIDEVLAGGWSVDDEVFPMPPKDVLLERAARRVLSTLLEQREKGQP